MSYLESVQIDFMENMIFMMNINHKSNSLEKQRGELLSRNVCLQKNIHLVHFCVVEVPKMLAKPQYIVFRRSKNRNDSHWIILFEVFHLV